MNGCPPDEVPYFERLFSLKFIPGPKWHSYSRSIAKEAGKNVQFILSLHKVPDFFYHTIYLQKADQTEYCCYISLHRVQNHLQVFVAEDLVFNLQYLSQRRNIASLSLLCCHGNGNCSDLLHSLVQPFQKFTVGTTILLTRNQIILISSLFQNLRRKFHLDNFFS